MISRINALGDRMLARLLPAATAAAAECPGQYIYSDTYCNYYCHCPSMAGCHKKRYCPGGARVCEHVCNACCF